jgi:AhpD family alkylhydroperoxidase
MTAPRITPGNRHEAGLFAWACAQVAGRLTHTNPPNLFLTMGRQHKLFRGWLRFAGRLMPGGTLPRRESELVILRVAHLRRCDYEFTHHVALGKRAGVTPDDVALVKAGPTAPGWSPRERVLLEAVDLLHGKQDLDDSAWDALRGYLDDAEAVEFVLLVGHYEMLATFVNTLRIRTDRHR